MNSNKRQIIETDEFKKFELELDDNIEFLRNFADLINFSGRIISFISAEKFHIVNARLLDNSVQTLRSIKLCSSIGCFADANTLIRKLRDDLLLYVYIMATVNQRNPFTKTSLDNLSLESSEEFLKGFEQLEFNTNLTDDEKAVDAWLNNKLLELPRNIRMKLSFENYMKVLKLNGNVETILVNYKLQDYWKVLTTKLNNYVHNNGSQFTFHNLIESDNKQLETYLSNVNIRTSYVISFFLVLITMIESALLCSGEVEDYLDFGIEPPEDCQYEIASFIQKFIDEKVIKLHPQLKQFLKDNNINGMKID